MEYVKRKTVRKARSSWSSVAFIVESILLLLFLVASLAVLTQVFSASLSRSIEGRTLDAATIAATSTAERFAADPTGIEESAQVGELIVKCDVTQDAREGGTMYHAFISVYDTAGRSAGDAVYTVETARYVSGSGV